MINAPKLLKTNQKSVKFSLSSFPASVYLFFLSTAEELPTFPPQYSLGVVQLDVVFD